ncbi:MAG: type 11 methyltransferase [Parcubacteria group bacterium LiPW_41]|nr:MAG: type 11 methyltransferase [Parcubacteria group bacterium LiPW_41]
MKLDIACGQNKREGFKGVDIISGPGVDFVWDLEQFPWEPFKDNSIEEVHISHYAEHTKDLMKFMNEVWRICENGAKVTILGPYYTSIRAWQDPTHTRALSEATWQYFSKDWRVMNKLDHYPIHSDFSVEKIMAFFNPPWDKKSDEAKQFAQMHYFNAVSDILVELKVVK